MYKDLVVERHQSGQHSNKISFILIDSMEEMNTTELAAHCAREIDSYRRGEPTSEEYSVELLRLAIVQGEPEAWKSIQQCFGELISSWLRYHPQWKIAIKLGSQDEYIALTFKRFKQMITLNQPIEFESLAEAFTYLRVCLNGVILDTLRLYSCSGEFSS
jgi:hypothetical protein